MNLFIFYRLKSTNRSLTESMSPRLSQAPIFKLQNSSIQLIIYLRELFPRLDAAFFLLAQFLDSCVQFVTHQ